MKKIKLGICIMLSMVMILLSTGYMSKADEGVIKELDREVVPLKTVKPNDDLKDLIPLKEILKDKNIVGMGEATHGTSEFFKMKHRVFKFLVEEMGFRAFAIEANFGEGEVINDYIVNGTGDELSVMNSLAFWIWKTDEFKDMINWMKEYNIKVKDKDKIRFYGFDMQYHRLEYDYLKNYLKKTKPELEAKFIDKIPCQIENGKYKSDIVDEIMQDFKVYKDEMIKKSSKEEYEIMMKNLDIIKQKFNISNISVKNEDDLLGLIEYSNFRDKSMAENINWIVNKEKEFGNEKVMLWAHNGHINKTKKELSDNNNTGIITWMGDYLGDMYGDKYYAIGFEFFKGEFRAISNNTIKVNKLKESNSKTLGYAFNKLGKSIFFLDLKKAMSNEGIKSWCEKNEVFINDIGSNYTEDATSTHMSKIDMNKDFDGLIFINETTESKLPQYNFKKDSTIKKQEEVKKTSKNNDIIIILGILVLSIGTIVAIQVVRKNKKKSI